MSIKHLLSYIVRGLFSEALQKLLEMTPSNLKIELRKLQDILANFFDRLFAISFSKGLDTLYERLNGICKTNNRNAVKVMIFIAINNEMVPIIHAFLADDAHLSSVNGVSYLQLLQGIIWPRLCHSETRSPLWWMQDGALPHCTNAALEFVNEMFRGRVISRRTKNSWSAHSLDLNSLNFNFCAAAQAQGYMEKPNSIKSPTMCPNLR